MESVVHMEKIGTKSVIRDLTSCPNCEKVAAGYYEINSLFGLRNMGNGTTRVQSWCIECRQRYSRGCGK